MQNIFIRLSLVFILIGCFVPLVFSQEAITITTYYPAPYGVYQQLMLSPMAAPPAADCNLNTEGTMYFDNASHQLMVCRQNTVGNFGWQSVGLWTRDGNNVYPDDTNWNVGIGTTAPTRKLDVNGYTISDDVYLRRPVAGSARWASQVTLNCITVSAANNGNGCFASCPAGYQMVSGG